MDLAAISRKFSRLVENHTRRMANLGLQAYASTAAHHPCIRSSPRVRECREIADSPRDCGANKPKLESAEADLPGILLAEVDVCDLDDRDQDLAAPLVGDGEDRTPTATELISSFSTSAADSGVSTTTSRFTCWMPTLISTVPPDELPTCRGWH